MTHTIDVSKGSTVTTVSRQWANRPADQKFLSLEDLLANVKARSDKSVEAVVDRSTIEVRSTEDGDIGVVGGGKWATLTNYSFGQLCRMAGAPSSYMAKLPGLLAAMCLREGMKGSEGEAAMYWGPNGALRAILSTKYQRVFDHQIVSAAMRLNEDGGQWKVPGVIDWSTMSYNAQLDVTKETTTLYASDRDVFLFLVDDLNPIEVGKLANGDPDLMFRGFYLWNSEVGASGFGMAAMYLRGVCQNRCLWGVEGFQEYSCWHLQTAQARFADEFMPNLRAFAHAQPKRLIAGVEAAKAAVIAKTDDDSDEFLIKLGFSKAAVKAMKVRHFEEEGQPISSVWDASQAITAFARDIPNTDNRIAVERIAGKLLDKVALC